MTRTYEDFKKFEKDGYEIIYNYLQDIRKTIINMNFNIEEIIQLTNKMYFVEKDDYDEIDNLITELEKFIKNNREKLEASKLYDKFNSFINNLNSYKEAINREIDRQNSNSDNADNEDSNKQDGLIREILEPFLKFFDGII